MSGGRFTLAWDASSRRATATGEVTETEGAALASALAALGPGPLTLDLGELDLLDGVAVAEAINGLRGALARCGTLRLRGAPQLLAHTLYKVGMLEAGGISLEDPRADEPLTAN